MVGFEAERLVAHDSLCAVCLALGEIAAHTHVVQIRDLACLDGGKLAARAFALLNDGAEVLPLAGSGEKGFRALFHVELGSGEVGVAEHIAAHRDAGGLESLHGEAVQIGAS